MNRGKLRYKNSMAPVPNVKFEQMEKAGFAADYFES
jgi:hypothetical protein